jgi:hypothetical protein
MNATNMWLTSASLFALLYQPVFGTYELPKIDLLYEVHQAISYDVRLSSFLCNAPYLIILN